MKNFGFVLVLLFFFGCKESEQKESSKKQSNVIPNQSKNGAYTIDTTKVFN
jgi:hypothetical protein